MVGRLSARLGAPRLTHAAVRTQVERFAAMGTWIELHQFGAPAPDALKAARRAIEAVDDALTIHRPSPTTALNDRLRAGEHGRADHPLLRMALAGVEDAWATTGGLFDATVGSAGGATWGALTLDRASGQVAASMPIALDFGGFGKGFALDQAVAALRAGGVTSALLSAGESSVAVIGEHPLGGAWPLAIPHPLDPDATLVELALTDSAVSVSSTLGVAAPSRSPSVRPHDGAIVTAAATTVVIDASGAAAEALSTALLVADPVASARMVAHAPQHRYAFTFSGADRPLDLFA